VWFAKTKIFLLAPSDYDLVWLDPKATDAPAITTEGLTTEGSIEGRKKKADKDKGKVDEQEDGPELRVFGDESEPRGSHRCGNIHIPPITVKYYGIK